MSRVPVAIIGAACRFPGASTPGELWRRVLEADSAIGPPPEGRWDVAASPYRGGFLHDVHRFDADRFGISDREAEALDPQQRVILGVAAEALARAPALGTTEVGVFIAGGQLAYMQAVLGAIDRAPKETLAGNILNMLAARIAHTFDLRGPAFTLDSACSGSLVAIHQACRAVADGDCEAALVGGVNLNLTPLVHLMFERAGALSPSGTLRPFTAGGDGTLPGDGAAVLVLEPLERALAHGHAVWAVIEGSAVNNSGKTIGVMTPGPEGQVAVMRRALADAGVPAAAISCVEAHATGTEIGDAVEKRSIDAVYPHGPRLGAVKAIVGHGLGASGCASVLAVMGQLAPGEYAGINGFGFGGTNAHLVLRGGEVPAEERARRAEPLSGRLYRIGARAADLDGWVHGVSEAGLLSAVTADGRDPLVRKGGYVITGASGGIGRVVARFLARNHRPRLVLVGRREASFEDLQRLGATVHYVRADLGDPAACARVVAEARSALGAVDGLFHAAGTLGEDALRAKRDGLLGLAALEPQLTVLFSSIAALTPGLDKGLEAYVEANRFLDRYARAEAARGRRIVSIAWPPWEEVGMAAARAAEYRARGIEPISPALAMPAMMRAISAGLPHVAVMRRRTSAARAATPVAPAPAAHWPSTLRAIIARVTGIPTDSMRDDQHITALGIDSLAAIDVVKAIEAQSGRTLPTTLLFENDTIAKLAAALEAGVEAAPAKLPSLAQPMPTTHVLELLDAQRTFLVQQQYFPLLPCNVLLACTVDAPDRAAPLDLDVLARALDILVDRHTVLASKVERREGRWLQVEGPRPHVEHRASLDVEQLANEVLDLERGPLVRVVTDGRRLAIHAHHLLLDAWSAKLVVEGLLSLHESLLVGESPPRAPAPETWWTVAPRLGATSSVDERWISRFSGGVPPISLPFDGDAGGPPRGPGQCVRIELSTSVTERLERLARASEVSMPALILASYAEMLFDVSGQHDVTVRVAHGQREARIEGINGVVGSFADSFPVRAEVGASLVETARRFARELTETQRAAGTSSLALAALADRGGAGPQGLTPAGFSYLGLASAARIGRLAVSEVQGTSASGFTRLALVGWTFDGRLTLSFGFLAGHFERATVEDFAQRQRAILEGALDGGRAPRPDRLDARLVEVCQHQGERPLTRGLTYAALERASAALATRLEGERVAVMADPSPEALVSVLGVMRAGAAYVPLDPSWPDARASAVLDVARPSALVTTAVLADRARAFGLPLVIARAEEVETQAPRPTVQRSPASDAYVMFTSGSTGGPKGVRVSHRAALLFLDWVERVLGVTSRDRFLQTSPLSFGASLRQMYAPILAGASLVIADSATKRDPSSLLRLIGEECVTIYNAVPSMWSFLMDAVERAGPSDLATLRWVLIGGEALPAASVRRWRSLVRGPRPRLANLYGAAETIVNATWFEVTGELPVDEPLTPIGWPRHGYRVSLVEVEGGVGELVVSGDIAQGYLGGQPGFEPDPAGGRAFRTGDRARRTRAGALVYLGRADGQVQVHGNRVELGEIEAVACDFPGVDAAIVRYSDGRLSATLEVRRGEPASAADVRSFIATRLPSYMVPHEVVFVRALERTVLGKTERKVSLRSTSSERPLSVEPRDVIVERAPASELVDVRGPVVAELWRALLHTDSVEPTSSFFMSGGDSMLAIELVTRVQERLGVVISPLWLHQHPTFRELEQAVASQPSVPRAAAAEHTTAPVGTAGRSVLSPRAPAPPVPGGVEAPSVWRAGDGGAHAITHHPLTPIQRAFWHASSEDGRGPLMTMAVPIHGPLDLDRLSVAVRAIQHRHPILRATFDGPRAQPTQHLGAAPAAILEIEDLCAAPERVAARVQEARETPMRLERGPPIRIKLLRVAPDHHILLTTAHHIAIDAHSLWVLLHEILADPAPLTIEPERAFLERTSPEDSIDPYWASTLDPASIPALSAEPHGHVARVHLPPAALAALAALARRRGTTPFALVFEAFARALQDDLATDDVIIATATTGREHDPLGLAGAVGPFARGVPVRVRSRDPGEVQASLRGALAHAATSTASLRAALGMEAALRLGRFFVSWIEPPLDTPGLDIAWPEAELWFATESTATEVSLAAVAHHGLTLHLRGTARAERLGRAMERTLQSPSSALIVYAPPGTPLPITAPTCVETVRTRFGATELILLPLTTRDLGDRNLLTRHLLGALDATSATTIALAGMLPSLTGLGRRALGDTPGRKVVVTTGHAATVVSMQRTVVLALERRGLAWANARVGILGFGAIGRATLELCVAQQGPPRSVSIADPRFGTTADAVYDCDLIIAATSGGHALDVARLAPGTVVVDDSFPRAFDDEAAWQRMDGAGDVILVGGGMWDVGPLVRESPFPEAETIRRAWPVRWLPGCHAEALLVAHREDLGPTIGEVSLSRALEVARATDALGWTVAPLHLGPREL